MKPNFCTICYTRPGEPKLCQACYKRVERGLTKINMTNKEKAEKYVREQCPELMELSYGQRIRNKNRPGDYLVVLGEAYDQVLHWNYEISEAKLLPHETIEIIGHPIQLQHWLRVLQGESFRTLTQREEHYTGKVVPDGELLVWHETGTQVYFNLTTGQPATEADYQAFNQIVGIN